MEATKEITPNPLPNNPVWFQEGINRYQRLDTKPVKVGKLTIGAGNPIWVQSMANTDTMDTTATVDQIKRLADVGCDIARITVPNLNAARNLEPIKSQLRSSGYDIPLVADIHFTPQAAMIAAEIVEKVRVNPGNFVDRKHFAAKEYTEDQYQQELERVEEKLIPLIEVCRKNGTAIRIGSNHGSLSDRIFNQYGDGPLGMVQSALEFLDICEREKFDQVVFSMKSSNTLVMVAAYRLLAHRLWERGTFYPIHLGVTEAGDDEDGRAKSALGIGSLLMDGIGDTVRVSLTEDPEKEIPVGRKIVAMVKHFTASETDQTTQDLSGLGMKSINPFEFTRSETLEVDTWGGKHPAQLMFSTNFPLKNIADLSKIGTHQIATTEKWHSTHSPDILHLSDQDIPLLPTLLDAGQKVIFSASEHPEERSLLYDSWNDYWAHGRGKGNFAAIRVRASEVKTLIENYQESPEGFSNTLLLLGGLDGSDGEGKNSLRSVRQLILALKGAGIPQPLCLSYKGLDCPSDFGDSESHKVAQAIYAGYLLVDGLIDGVFMEQGGEEDLKYMFSVLQASRQRISKPEYISCPSCGRTLFDLQEVTAKVKAATHHLVGVKIAVMGCIVNGPGEMADADFGYVGSGPGKITLYKGKEVMVKSVNSSNAVQELVNLIKREGYWQEPKLI